ncbi:MAG: SDR family NAD(P)-dependent oxidoreductase [Fimbriimonadaceae bacterium]|nr:SDR family NAD(P)-dependent oxidoreductase [Alphaproteobacteria bacterium]
MSKIALIVGAGSGISASLARLLSHNGYRVALAARDTSKLTGLQKETDAVLLAADAHKPDDVTVLFDRLESEAGPPDVVVYNASARSRGPLIDLDPAAVKTALEISAYGGFLTGQAAARSMLKRAGGGTILFTGASASVKGYAESAPFAMGKFALRGLAQSMARELQPKGIHVCHIVIDGAVRNPGRREDADRPDSMLDPDAIAETYLQLIRQPRNAWSWEMELRPWTERF